MTCATALNTNIVKKEKKDDSNEEEKIEIAINNDVLVSLAYCVVAIVKGKTMLCCP